MIRKIIIWVMLLTFNISLVSPLQAQVFAPAGTPVAPVPVFNPALIKGLTIHPENPLMFDFIIHPGDEYLQADQFKKESQKLIKYFLASLTVPEDKMWVNLSPTEKDRIIPDEFGQTEMGRDLLMQDYFLKKLTASLISPEHKAGKELWEKIYSQTQEKFGTTNIPMDILSKVWIVPQSAKIYENGQSVFVVDAHLKVLMERDYKSGQWSEVTGQENETSKQPLRTDHLALTTQIMKDILLPTIEHEVNNGPAFANLRQIYNSVILATWYKKNLKQSLLGQVYVDRGKTEGVSHHDPKAKESIYNQYLEAFKKGADAIQEEYDPATQEVITRKYISGGMDLAQLSGKVQGVTELPRSLEGSNEVRVRLGSVDRAQNAESLVPDVEIEDKGQLYVIQLKKIASPGSDSITWEAFRPKDQLKTIFSVLPVQSGALNEAQRMQVINLYRELIYPLTLGDAWQQVSDIFQTTVLLSGDKVAGIYTIAPVTNFIRVINVAKDFRGTGAVDVLFEDLKERYAKVDEKTYFSANIVRGNARSIRGEYHGTLNEIKKKLGVISQVELMNPDAAMTASPHDPHISVELEEKLPFRIDRPIFTGPHTAAFEELAKAYRDLVSQWPFNERDRNTFKSVLQNVLSLTDMNVLAKDLDDYIQWLQSIEVEMSQESFKKIDVINQHLIRESVKNGFIFMPGVVLKDNGILHSSRKFHMAGPIVGVNYAPGLSKRGENTGIFTFSVWSFVFNDEFALYLNEFDSKDALFSVIPYRFQTSQGVLKKDDQTQMVQSADVDIPLSNKFHQYWSDHDTAHTLTSSQVYTGGENADRLDVRDDFGTDEVGGFTGLQRFDLYMNNIVAHRNIEKIFNYIFAKRTEERDQFLMWEASAVGYGFSSQAKNAQDQTEIFWDILRLIRDSREGNWINIVPRIFWVVSMLDEMSAGLNIFDQITIGHYKKAILRMGHWKTVIQEMLDSEELEKILRKVNLDQINRRVYKQIAGFDLKLPAVRTPQESLRAWKDYVAEQEWGNQVQFTDAAILAETGFTSKASVLTEARIQIREMLEAAGVLQSREINTAMALIENHRVIYKALGLLNYNYHDFVHSLVVTKVMMLNLQADQKATARDWKVGFVAALLHDFHIRDKDKEDNPKQGTVAYVPETIRQIKQLLNMPNGNALPQEYLFEIFLKDPVQGPVLQQLAGNIRTLLSEDFEGMMHEVLALILRTHNAYNVAPAPAEYLKKGKVIRATIETSINAGDVKTTDIEKYVKHEYKKILAEVKANDKMDTNQKNITETWLKQQEIVELGYLEGLNKVEKSRQIENNLWAIKLEKVADKGGNYLVDLPDMIENEIMSGLMVEVPAIKLIENYQGFVKNELLNEEVLQLISPLPAETKRLFMRNIRHFAAIAGESDEWDTQLSLQVEKKFFPKGDAAQIATPIIEEVLKRQLTDPSIEAPGGIDLNPEKIQFDRQGQPVDFNLPLNDTLIQEYLNIQGFEPVIINITPITNIPLLLGTAKPTSPDHALTKI